MEWDKYIMGEAPDAATLVLAASSVGMSSGFGGGKSPPDQPTTSFLSSHRAQLVSPVFPQPAQSLARQENRELLSQPWPDATRASRSSYQRLYQ